MKFSIYEVTDRLKQKISQLLTKEQKENISDGVTIKTKKSENYLESEKNNLDSEKNNFLDSEKNNY